MINLPHKNHHNNQNHYSHQIPPNHHHPQPDEEGPGPWPTRQEQRGANNLQALLGSRRI